MDAPARAPRHLDTEMTTHPDTADEALSRTPLSDLIRDAQGRGLSLQDMADRSDRAGHPVSKPQFHKYASGAANTAPSPDRLRGIAAGIGRPLAVVQRAAAHQYLEYETTELSGYDDTTRVIVAHLAGMSPTERRRWQRMIEASEQVRDDET